MKHIIILINISTELAQIIHTAPRGKDYAKLTVIDDGTGEPYTMKINKRTLNQIVIQLTEVVDYVIRDQPVLLYYFTITSEGASIGPVQTCGKYEVNAANLKTGDSVHICENREDAIYYKKAIIKGLKEGGV